MTEAAQGLVAAAQTGDKEAQEILLREHTPLVWSVAKRFFGRGCEADDLFQLGCIGLLKAVRDFDLTRPVAFSTYAVPKIAGEMRRFLRDDGPVKLGRALREDSIKVAAAANQLRLTLGREPRISELAAATGLELEQVAACLQASQPVRSLEEPAGEEGMTLAQTLGEDREDALVEQLSLRCAVDRLEPRLRQVLVLRYFKDMTQQRVAERLGLSQVQVSRLEKKALLAMRQQMG